MIMEKQGKLTLLLISTIFCITLIGSASATDVGNNTTNNVALTNASAAVLTGNTTDISSTAGNRFNNSGFETGNSSGWTTGSNTSVTSTEAHSGQYSLHFGLGGNQNTNYAEQNVDLTLVDSISFWGYQEGGIKTPFDVYIDGKLVKPFYSTPDAWTEYMLSTSDYTGNHTIELVWLINGCSFDVDDFSTSISKNQADFTSNTSTDGSKPLTVQFHDSSVGLITGWLWSFGDGTTSTEENPTHVYSKPGTYNVTLTVTGPYCTSTKTINNVVTFVGPTNTRTGKTYETLQDAIDDAADGDTIDVGNDSYMETYIENIKVNKRLNITGKGDVILKALDPNNPVITVLKGGSNSIISGFNIIGATYSSGISILSSVSATITNNTFTGNNIGINVDGSASIVSNTITANNIGINVDGTASIVSNTITANNIGINVGGNAGIHFNNIYENTLYGLKFAGNGVDATNNWWGTNNPTYMNGTSAPGKTDIYEADNNRQAVYDPWIVLRTTASSGLLKSGDNSTITVDMTHNSKGQDTSGSGSIPNLPVNFNYTLGTLSTTSTTTSKGKATTTVTGGNTSGTDNLTVTVEGYTSTVPITVDTIAPTINGTPGGTFSGTQTVNLTSDDPTATIYYTSDGTDPRTSSTRIKYTGPISVSSTTTLRYAAVDPAGNWSPLCLQNYVIETNNGPAGSNSEYGGNAGQSGYKGPQTGTTKWTYGNITVYGSAVIGPDGTIYIGGSDGVLYVFNSNGKLKWTWTTRSGILGSPAISADGTIYVSNGENSTLYAINSNGTLKWKYTVGNYNSGSSPVIGADGTIYIPTTNSSTGILYAFYPNGKVKWAYNMGPIYGSSVAIGQDGTIYIADYNGILYAINTDGTQKWSYTLKYCTGYMVKVEDDGTKKTVYFYETANVLYGTPSIGPDGTIYIGNQKGILFAINPDGTLKWACATGGSWDAGEALYGAPAISSDGVIYVVGASKLYAIRSSDGTLLWSYDIGGVSTPEATSPVIGSDGTIYVGSSKGVYALNPNGMLKWSSLVGDICGSPVIGSDGTLYIGTVNGTLYAFNDVGVKFTSDNPSGSTVQFGDNSTCNPVSWNWDFGDGTTSTEKNPVHTYNKRGDYNVSLAVTLSSGVTLTVTRTVSVDKDTTAPVVNGSTGGSFNTSQTVTLTASDNSGSATIYYTTDGSDPRTSTTRIQYKSPFTVNDTTTINYAAVDPSGNWSPVYNATYAINPVSGTIVYVQDGLSNDEIQSILDKAAPGSTIIFLGQEYDGLHLVINKKLNIISNVGTKISSDSSSPVFLVDGSDAAGTTIGGFTIINAGTGPGILVNNTINVTIANDQITSTKGSAILVKESINTVIKNCSLTNSITGVNVSSSSGTEIIKSNITGNTGRGVGIYSSLNTTVDNCTITGNGTDARTNDEGGIYVQASDGVKITNNQINNNFEGISTKDIANTFIDSNTINDNIGDAIYLMGYAGSLTITKNTIERDCNGIRIDYTDGENINIESNIITGMICSGNKKHIPDYDSTFTDSGDGITFGVDYGMPNSKMDSEYIAALNKALTLKHNFIYDSEGRNLDGHDSNIDTIDVDYNVYGLTWAGDNPFEALGGARYFCCKFRTHSSNLKVIRTGSGTYTAYFVDGDTKKPITDLPSVGITLTAGGVSQTVMMVNGVATATFSPNSLVGQILASWYKMTASTDFDSEITGGSGSGSTGSDGGYKAAAGGDTDSGSNPGTGGSGSTGGSSSSGSTGSSGSVTSSSGSSASSLSSTVGATQIAAAAAAASQGSSAGSSSSPGSDSQGKTSQSNPSSQSKTVQELIVNKNNTKNSEIWGIVGIIVLIILVLGLYYRKDLMSMIRKSKNK